MARLRFLAVALVALAFACSSIQMGRTQPDTLSGVRVTESKPDADDSRVIYSLTEMGYDAHLGKWIAETIPEMIEPSSWGGLKGAIRYYAPKNILIVKQTKAIQKEVDGFLKELKTSMPKASAAGFASKMPSTGVVPADYREPALLRASTPVSEPSSYPVPAAVKPPKHLFHFIIRYEGDGIIDDNVVKFMKAQLQGAKSPVSVSLPSAAYVPGAPPVVSVAPSTPGPGYVVPATPYNGPVPAGTTYGGSVPSAEPVLQNGSPATSIVPASPSPAPKKKKEKKDDHKKTTVTS